MIMEVPALLGFLERQQGHPMVEPYLSLQLSSMNLRTSLNGYKNKDSLNLKVKFQTVNAG